MAQPIQPRRDPLFGVILAAAAAAPEGVALPDGAVAPISPTAAARLRERLLVVAQMHEDNELTDAQLPAAVHQLVKACEDTSVLHYQLQPAQIEAANQAALSAIAEMLTEDDIAALNAIQ